MLTEFQRAYCSILESQKGFDKWVTDPMENMGDHPPRPRPLNFLCYRKGRLELHRVGVKRMLYVIKA